MFAEIFINDILHLSQYANLTKKEIKNGLYRGASREKRRRRTKIKCHSYKMLE